MSKRRTYSKFLTSFGNEGARNVSLEYATNGDIVTLDLIAEKYNTSSKVMKKVFEYAIINCLVSYQAAKLMQAKAHRNQTRHLNEEPTETPSDKYYSKILAKRLDFVKKFDDEKVKEIVDAYLKSPQLSAFSVAESVGLSKKEINTVLKKSIIFNIVDDETVKKLCEISLNKTPGYVERILITELFRQYTELRKIYIALNSKISQLYFQIEAYENFISSDEELEHSIEDLSIQLKKAEKELEKFKNVF